MFKLYFLTRECFTRGDRKISPNGLIFALFSHPGINARKKKIQCRVPNSASRFTSARRVSRGVWDTRVLKHVVFVASNFVLFWKFKRIVFESSHMKLSWNLSLFVRVNYFNWLSVRSLAMCRRRRIISRSSERSWRDKGWKTGTIRLYTFPSSYQRYRSSKAYTLYLSDRSTW